MADTALMVSQEPQDDADAVAVLVKAKILDGYSFRAIIAYFRAACPEMNFVFTKSGFSIARTSTSNASLITVDIEGSELIDYEYNIVDEFDADVESFRVGVKLSELHRVTKGLRKKDQLVLWMIPGSTTLFVRRITENSREGHAPYFVVPTTDVEESSFVPPKYITEENNPTIKVSINRFSNTCQTAVSLKSSKIAIHGYPKGIRWYFYGPDGSFQHTDPYGECPPASRATRPTPLLLPPGPPSEGQGTEGATEGKYDGAHSVAPSGGDAQAIVPYTGPRFNLKNSSIINFKLEDVKPMGKLNNLNAVGIVKIIVEEKKPLKIVSKIGGYGTLRIYLRDRT